MQLAPFKKVNKLHAPCLRTHSTVEACWPRRPRRMARTRAPRGSSSTNALTPVQESKKERKKVAKVGKKVAIKTTPKKKAVVVKKVAKEPQPNGKASASMKKTASGSRGTRSRAKASSTKIRVEREGVADDGDEAEVSEKEQTEEIEEANVEPDASVQTTPKKSSVKRRAEEDEKTISTKRLKLDDYVMCGPGQLLSLGTGDTGQLGLGPDILERSKPALVKGVDDVVAVAAGGMHTVILNSQGEVLTFGCNDEGCLGRHTSDDDDCYQPGKVSLPSSCVAISAGDSHSAALTVDGDVYYWGNFRDNSGFLGLTVSGGKQEAPLKLDIQEFAIRIASGEDHLAVLTSDSKLYTLGNGEQGQLGRIGKPFLDRGGRRGLQLFLKPEQVRLPRKKLLCKDVWAGSMATFVLTNSDQVYVFGLNNYHQLSLSKGDVHLMPTQAKKLSESGKNDGGWKQVCPGEHYALALANSGQVYAFGRCEYGRLGLGESETKEDILEPTVLPGLKEITHIATGSNVSMAVNRKGHGFSWGMGTNMQLGHSDDADSWVPKQVEGKNLQNNSIILAAVGAQHALLVTTAVKDD